MNQPRLARVPRSVRAVFFDAVGTVIHPEPSAGAAYAEFGRRFGSRLEASEVRRRFAAAFQREEDEDARRGHRTDEGREVQRWRRIVAGVLDDVADREGCFAALYEHFANPAAWRADADAARVMAALSAAGYQVGLATNFDRRLRGVLAGLPGLAGLSRVVISSEVGWKKPAAGFFACLCEQAGLSPGEVLLVGDDVDNDHAGAVAAGLHALLLDPGGRSGLPDEQRLGSLVELITPGVG